MFLIFLVCVCDSYLNTDSTKTRNAFTWIHAQKVSLKFTFNHRTNGPYKNHNTKIQAHSREGRVKLEIESESTYELLLFIGHQFGDFTFASCQFFFVVGKVTHDKLLFTCMQFEFLNHLPTAKMTTHTNNISNANLLEIPLSQLRWNQSTYLFEKCYVEECVISILGDQLRWTWNNHVCDFLIVLGPIIHIGSVRDKTKPTGNLLIHSQPFAFDTFKRILTLERWPTMWSNTLNREWSAPSSLDRPNCVSTNFHWSKNKKNKTNGNCNYFTNSMEMTVELKEEQPTLHRT